MPPGLPAVVKTPLVSVIIPSNRPWMLCEAMGSVFNQTFTDYQMLVGYATAWWPSKINELAKSAVGKYIVTLCDDDLLMPTFLEKTVEQAEAGHDLVYTNWGRMKGTEIREWPSEPWTLASFQSGGSNPLCGATWLVNREKWLSPAVGGMDPNLLFWDWGSAYACYRAGFTAAKVPEVLAIYREHDQHDPVDDREAMRQLHAKYPELKRAA